MFLSSMCLGAHGTFDIRISVYKGREAWEEHIPKNSVSDVLGKGRNT